VERHLQHAEEFVRVETLRALSEALFELTKEPKGSQAFQDVFPDENAPRVVSAEWLFAALARFLFAHPSTLYGSECDASTWAAVSVLLNLVRLFPDSVMVIGNRITIARVNPLVFGILERRLNSTRDANILKRLRRYIPWPGRDPLLSEIVDHCRPFSKSVTSGLVEVAQDLGVSDGEPDYNYLHAYAECYHLFARMIDAMDLEALQDLPRTPMTLPVAPEWIERFGRDRKQFMQFAAVGIDKILGGLDAVDFLNPDEVALEDSLERVRMRFRAMLDQLASGAVEGATLFAPEVSIARTILENWIRVIQPPLPTRGASLGEFRLGDPIRQKSFVFSIEGHQDLVASYTIIRSAAENKSARKIAKVLREESSVPASRLAPIVGIKHLRSGPVLIMKRVDGEDMEHAWPALIKRDGEERVRLALGCMIDIASALDQLHRKELCHGDVQGSNIIWDKQKDLFTLIDFEKAGNEERLASGSYAPPSHIDERHFRPVLDKIPERINRLKTQDTMALAQLCYRLVAGQAAEGSYHGHLDANISADLRQWISAINRRWDKPADFHWLPTELTQEAVKLTLGCFVGGASDDTRKFRDLLYLEGRRLHEWFVQGHYPLSGWEPTLRQLHAHIMRSQAVVLLLGRSAGSAVADASKELLEKAASLGCEPTYVIYEFMAASALQKPMVCLQIDDDRSDYEREHDPLAGLRRHIRQNQGTIKRVTAETVVEVVLTELKVIFRAEAT
jgi:hypothetical protein